MSRDRAKRSSNFLPLSENQKHFLSLINEYAAEKLQGEKSVVVLRKRMGELRSELEAANDELENVKRTKETTEQELKGCEVELSMNETSIQTLEARISVLQGEIASVRSELDSLQFERGAIRDQFFIHMVDLNEKIRKFQYQLYKKNTGIEPVGHATEESHELEGDNTKTSSESVEETLVKVVTQIANEDNDYLLEEEMKNQNQQMLIDLEKKKTAMEMLEKGAKELENLTSDFGNTRSGIFQYTNALPGVQKIEAEREITLTTGLEGSYSRLSEKLLNSCICPQCHQDNSEALDNISQVNEAN